MKRTYYAVIPAYVRYDKDLTPNAKLMFGELTALSNDKGYCYASNKYFSEHTLTLTHTRTRTHTHAYTHTHTPVET